MESILSLTRVSRRRRNIILACCALGAGGYISYRVYTSPSVARKRLQLYRFFRSLSLLLETAAEGSDCVGVLWKDLHSFVRSNENEVPQSLKQLFKVGQTREFQTSMALLCMSVTQGVVSSLSGRDSILQDGSDYGSALFEELSSQKEGVRKSGVPVRNVHQSWKDRRWRSSGEIDGLRHKDMCEGDLNLRPKKLHRSGSASWIDGEEADRLFKGEEEAGRYSAWKSSKTYYREKGFWAGAPMAETSGESGKGKSRSQGKRRRRVDRNGEGLPERLVGKLFTEPGKGFASVVVASAARSLVLSVLEGYQLMKQRNLHFKRGNVWSSADLEGKGGRDPHLKEAGRDGFQQDTQNMSASSPSSSFQNGLIDFLCSGKGTTLLADCIENFIGTAVSTYLDKTRDVHFYEDILASVAKPARREHVKELLTSVCNGAVETLIRTSHDVMSVGASGPSQVDQELTNYRVGSLLDGAQSGFSLGKSSCFTDFRHSEVEDSGECGRSEGGNDEFTTGSLLTSDNHDAESLSGPGVNNTQIAFDHSPQIGKKVISTHIDDVEAILLPPSSSRQINGKANVGSPTSTGASQGWIEGVSRTLAVPSNRALVLDVAGTMSAEAVRSAIEVVASKVALTVRGKPSGNDPILEARPPASKVLSVVNKTGEMVQATAAKAMVAVTMCLAICLHTLVGPS